MNKLTNFIIIILLSIGVFSVYGQTEQNQITVENHQNRSTVRYSVVLLRGKVGQDAGELKINNANTPSKAVAVKPVIHQGQFKALVELSPGKNLITLRTETAKPLEFELNYQPQSNPYYIRMVWMTDNGGDTTFAAPSDDVPQDYEARLRTAALLMQTFTAERMYDLGFGRRTFRLERDSDGKVVVHTWKAPERSDYYRDLGKSYGPIARWLNREHHDPFAKNVVLAAFTRKDSQTGKMIAHTALGGGNLGLFGSGSVFAWPRNLADAVDVFQNDSKVDPSKVHDDSAFRGSYWGLASTTIGATLHETCHTFGLPHCKDRLCIMTRGFDHFNRVFTFYDPPSRRNSKARYFTRKEEAYFAPVSASYLRWNRWFQLDEVKYPDSERPRISIDNEKVTVTTTSTVGIPWVGFWVGSDIYTYCEFKDDHIPSKIEIPREEIDQILKGKQLSTITAIGANGKSGRVRVKK